jgi:DNA-directed RNA polymerase subunit omega
MFKLPDNLENKYRFVTLAAKRAEQLQVGAIPRVAASERKATVIAQEEVAAGLVDLWDPEAEEAELDVAVEEEEEE